MYTVIHTYDPTLGMDSEVDDHMTYRACVELFYDTERYWLVDMGSEVPAGTRTRKSRERVGDVTIFRIHFKFPDMPNQVDTFVVVPSV